MFALESNEALPLSCGMKLGCLFPCLSALLWSVLGLFSILLFPPPLGRTEAEGHTHPTPPHPIPEDPPLLSAAQETAR